MTKRKKTYLGKSKLYPATYYLEDFEWACNWFWSGGIIFSSHSSFHFNGAFLDIPDPRGHPLGDFVTPWDKNKTDTSIVLKNGSSIWEPVTLFLDNVPEHISNNWWRIKDLYKQFYDLRNAAQVFRHGGHCTPQGRTPQEIRPEAARMINEHIADVIIPETRKLLTFS
jgi:hypothetical protein